MIRLFAQCTNEGAVSELGLAYVDALVSAGLAVRVIAVDVAELWDAIEERTSKRTGEVIIPAQAASRWSKHRKLFGIPVISPYINVVCTAPEPHWQRLYTVGVRNVLVTDLAPTRPGSLYQQIIVPSEEIAPQWRAVAPGRVTVVPRDLGQVIAALLLAVMGPPAPPEPDPALPT
jgi:hypothetical protein